MPSLQLVSLGTLPFSSVVNGHTNFQYIANFDDGGRCCVLTAAQRGSSPKAVPLSTTCFNLDPGSLTDAGPLQCNTHDIFHPVTEGTPPPSACSFPKRLFSGGSAMSRTPLIPQRFSEGLMYTGELLPISICRAHAQDEASDKRMHTTWRR